MAGRLDLAQLAIGVVRELVGGRTGIPSSLLDHRRLQRIQRVGSIDKARGITVIAACDRHALLEQVALPRHQLQHLLDVGRRYRHDTGHIIAITHAFGDIALGLHVDDFGGRHRNLGFGDPVGFQETDDLRVRAFHRIVQREHVVSHLLIRQRPNNPVGLYFPFGKALDSYNALTVLEMADTSAQQPTGYDHPYGQHGRTGQTNPRIFHNSDNLEFRPAKNGPERYRPGFKNT